MGYSLNYYDNPLNYPDIRELYYQKLARQKEIDFQQILSISKELVSQNPFIAENISKTIRCIHVDEYQDTQEEQYQILAPIVKANKCLNIMFVGDVNQAIYGGLGGVAKTREQLNDLMMRDFKEDYLSGCYRSTQRIVNFYTHFEILKTGVSACSDDLKGLTGTICYNFIVSKNNLADLISQIITEEISKGTKEEEICVIAPQWGLLFAMSNELKRRLPNVQFDAPEVSPFKRDPLNPFYLMARLIYSPPGVDSQIRKRIANEILSILKDEYHVFMNEKLDAFDVLKLINSFRSPGTEGIDYYEECVRKTLYRMGIDLQYEDGLVSTFDSFVQKSRDRIKHYKITNTNESISAFFHEKSGVVLNTIHGIKGEEYTTVIAFGLLNGYLPHWDYILDSNKVPSRKSETKKLLYVLCSRAKKNLYLFSETDRYTNKGRLYYPTDELKSVSFVYD